MTKIDAQSAKNPAIDGSTNVSQAAGVTTRAVDLAMPGNALGRLPRHFFDITADGTHQGKTTVAARLRAHCEDAGLAVTMVRIESEHVARGLREGDVLVPVEEIGKAGKVVGGIVGILEPALAAVTRMLHGGGVVIMDWGGGLGDYRLELLATTGLGQILAQEGIPAWSVVVATGIETSMAQGLRVLERTAQIAPDLKRALVLNQLHGNFDVASSTPLGQKKGALLAHKGLGATLNIPLASGQAMAALAPLGTDHRTLLEMVPEDVAKRLGVSPFLARAILAHFAAWYTKSAEEIEKIAPFSN